MSRRIIIPQGVIDPKNITIIDIPAELQDSTQYIVLPSTFGPQSTGLTQLQPQPQTCCTFSSRRPSSSSKKLNAGPQPRTIQTTSTTSFEFLPGTGGTPPRIVKKTSHSTVGVLQAAYVNSKSKNPGGPCSCSTDHHMSSPAPWVQRQNLPVDQNVCPGAKQSLQTGRGKGGTDRTPQVKTSRTSLYVRNPNTNSYLAYNESMKEYVPRQRVVNTPNQNPDSFWTFNKSLNEYLPRQRMANTSNEPNAPGPFSSHFYSVINRPLTSSTNPRSSRNRTGMLDARVNDLLCGSGSPNEPHCSLSNCPSPRGR